MNAGSHIDFPKVLNDLVDSGDIVTYPTGRSDGYTKLGQVMKAEGTVMIHDASS